MTGLEKLERCKPQEFVGKTIKSVDSTACNTWEIKFTDGSSMVLDYEYIGSGNLYGLIASRVVDAA